MFDQLIARWWIVAVRGAAALAFGVTALTPAAGGEGLGPTYQQAIVNLTEPTLIGSTIVRGPVMFTHDVTKMARGEPCTTVYLVEPGKGRGDEVASFHCVPIARNVARQFRITTEPNAGLGYGCVLTEYQFAGDSEGHGVPSPIVLAH